MCHAVESALGMQKGLRIEVITGVTGHLEGICMITIVVISNAINVCKRQRLFLSVGPSLLATLDGLLAISGADSWREMKGESYG
jgi:hypothetical protein